MSPQFVNHALSLMAVCVVVMLLVNQVVLELDADQLAAAIKEHIELYKVVYGDDSMKPKHHYVLHLPGMLLRFGFLFATFVHERKHRLAKKYMAVRRTLVNFEKGVLQDVTSHQIWELQQSFFMAAEVTTTIKNKMLRDAVQDMLPGVHLKDISVITQVACVGGRAMKDDVVSFIYDGVMCVGEMLLTIGIHDNNCSSYSIIALWRFKSKNGSWLDFYTDGGGTIMAIATDESLRGVHIHRMARDRQTCSVHMLECNK